MSGPTSVSRRHLILAGAGASIAGGVQAAPASIASTDSLPKALAGALDKGSPLVVMVSLEGCPFCKVAREHYLIPLREQQGVSMVQVDMRGRLNIQDFSGSTVTQDQLTRHWGIKAAPTLLFFGRGGMEVAERLVGASIPDFYGAYLDDRLRIARLALVAAR